MVCRRSFVLSPWTTQMLEAGLKTITNENKTKQNKTDKTARRSSRCCKSHYHLCRLLSQSYWFSPHLRYATYNRAVSTPVTKQRFQIAGAVPNYVVFFHCLITSLPGKKNVLQIQRTHRRVSTYWLLSVNTHMKMNRKYSLSP